jgi:hypothetical protein
VQASSLNYQSEADVAPLAPNVEPPLHAPPRPSGFNNDQLASDQPSFGGRIFRALARFLLPVLIGIAATLAWQSHGNEAIVMLRAWAPSLGWLLPVSTKLPSDSMVSGQNAVLPQSAPVAQMGEATTAVTSHELAQQLEPAVRDLAAVRQSLDQLAAKQDQMVQNIAKLQAAEQEIRQKMSSLFTPRTTTPRKPSQPAAQSPAVQSSLVPSPAPSAQPPLPLR